MSKSEADLLDQIIIELSVYGRRVRSVVGAAGGGLSFVEYSLLGFIADEGPCRAADLVRVYGLDKSTISRQVSGLVDRHLVDRSDDGLRLLRLTPAGHSLLDQARAVLREQVDARLASWTPEERRVFADLLRRYNAAQRLRSAPSAREIPRVAAWSCASLGPCDSVIGAPLP
jgi:DNA-binding MarR family transcriptional regulator